MTHDDREGSAGAPGATGTGSGGTGGAGGTGGRGSLGERGQRGEAGERGEAGARGEAGERGERGPAGVAPPKQLNGEPTIFTQMFEETPGTYAILDFEFDFIDASPEFLSVTLTKREDLLGTNVFELFPGGPGGDGPDVLRESLEKVRDTLKPDKIELRYDIERPEQLGGGYEVRYWQVENTPVVGEDGRLAYIVNKPKDVTQRKIAEATTKADIRGMLRAALVGYVLLFAGVFYTVYGLEQEGEEFTAASREGCARQNTIRATLGTLVEREHEINAKLLRRKNLGTLEPFRKEIAERQGDRANSLRALKRDVREHRREGTEYEVDCPKAFP